MSRAPTRLLAVFSFSGRIGRRDYALWGLGLFFLKYNLDRLIGSAVFDRPWLPTDYLLPGSGLSAEALGSDPDARNFALALLLAALPFIYLGVALTVRRLRSAGLSVWLSALFFVPFVNLLFFGLLCACPESGGTGQRRGAGAPADPPVLSRWIPASPLGSAAVGLVGTTLTGALLAAFSVEVLDTYGWGIFVGIPFFSGLASAFIYGYHSPRALRECIWVAFVSVLLLGAFLLAIAFEGVICLLMAAPIAAPLALLGGGVGYLMQRGWSRGWQQVAPLAVVMALLPALMGFEAAAPRVPPRFEVRSAIEVDARPEAVWDKVIAFGRLDEPEDWLFKAGIAYPVEARIEGSGPGAVRYCVFSTGSFVEPIKVWDEPRRLAFSVRSQPRPMVELSPYPALDAPHLDDFLVTEEGEFLLEPIDGGGRTRLVGTTWYRHKIWPSAYWRRWSDFIIHRIHLRVLRHVRRGVERS